MVNPPLPFMLLASTNRMSPPDGVQASPTTTPARLVRSAISPSLRILMPPRNSCTTSLVTTKRSSLPSARRRACLRQMGPIERFEQRRRGITAKIAADFVDFVEHENRIFGLSAADALDDLSRQRTDVSAPVTANFSFVMHAAKGQTNEFAAQSACNGFTERSLPHSRGADEAKNWTFHSRLEPAN